MEGRKIKNLKYKPNFDCTICGAVISDIIKHLNYSHPKIKALCDECNGTGRHSLTTSNKDGTFTINDCNKCKGSGAYETEERK